MVAKYPLSPGFFGAPGKRKRTDPLVNSLRNKDNQAINCSETPQQRKKRTAIPQRLFGPHTPSDDEYHLGRMIYTL
jgi:hypothetical protein